eukprot:1040733-Pleurochrysis_carterae.AAC.1
MVFRIKIRPGRVSRKQRRRENVTRGQTSIWLGRRGRAAASTEDPMTRKSGAKGVRGALAVRQLRAYTTRCPRQQLAASNAVAVQVLNRISHEQERARDGRRSGDAMPAAVRAHV